MIDEYSRKKPRVGRNFAYKPVAVKGRLKLGDFVRMKIVSAGWSVWLGRAGRKA